MQTRRRLIIKTQRWQIAINWQLTTNPWLAISTETILLGMISISFFIKIIKTTFTWNHYNSFQKGQSWKAGIGFFMIIPDYQWNTLHIIPLLFVDICIQDSLLNIGFIIHFRAHFSHPGLWKVWQKQECSECNYNYSSLGDLAREKCHFFIIIIIFKIFW